MKSRVQLRGGFTVSDLDFLGEEENRHSKYYKKKQKKRHGSGGSKKSPKQSKKNRNRAKKVHAMWMIIILIIIGVILSIVIYFTKKTKDNGNTMNSQTEATTTLKQDGGDLLDTNNQEVLNLVNAYFDAKMKGDTNKMSELVDSMTDDDQKKIQQENKYIEAYQNINVYTKEGLKDGSFVAYVYYEAKFANINTAAPGSIVLYLQPKDDKSGLCVHTYTKDSEVINYIKGLEKDKDVVSFYNTVEAKLVEACDSDNDLKTFYQKLTKTK